MEKNANSQRVYINARTKTANSLYKHKNKCRKRKTRKGAKSDSGGGRVRVEITSQNHGFCVDIETLPSQARITHINLNDQTLEGMKLTDCPAFSVQYHPEASPGPHDASYLFQRFVDLMASGDQSTSY